MRRADEAKSVTHVSDVNCHPCPGLNRERREKGKHKSNGNGTNDSGGS